MHLFLKLCRAIKRTSREGIFGVAFDEALVSFDRAFHVALFFRSLSNLKQFRCIPAYFFLARRHELRFLSARFARLSMARILCPLPPDCGSGFNLLWCSRRKHRSPLGRDDSGQLSFRLQIPSRDHAYLPATRL